MTVLGTVAGLAGAATATMAAAGAWQAWRYTHPPRIRTALHPRDLGVPHADVAIPSGPYRLAAWHLPAESGRGVVLLHGTPFDKGMVLRFGRRLQRRGFHVLMPDFRAHGETIGGTRTFGIREADDVLASVDWLRAQGGIDPDAVGVMGLSMGAVASLYAAARDPHIAAVVADSPFADLGDVIERRFRQRPLARLLIPTVTRIGARLAGVALADIAPRNVVRAIGGRPVFLIHGDADALTPVDHSRELYALLSEPKELWIEEGAGHVETSTVDPDAYLERVAGFFDRHLQTRASGFGTPVGDQ